MLGVATLILIRHGQSVWNSEPSRFTGWCDVPLTVKGRVEAVSVGQLLRSRGFRAENVDVAFTSELQRAHETCELALASMAGHEQDTWSPERIRRDVCSGPPARPPSLTSRCLSSRSEKRACPDRVPRPPAGAAQRAALRRSTGALQG